MCFSISVQHNLQQGKNMYNQTHFQSCYKNYIKYYAGMYIQPLPLTTV